MDSEPRHGRRGRSRRAEPSRAAGGLRLFSLKVVEKISSRMRTTYNAVANELVNDQGGRKDGKSIRRRCYDAINVLLACGLIKRDDRKQIVWRGHGSVELDRLRAELDARRREVERKRVALKELESKQKALLALLERNPEQPTEDGGGSVPGPSNGGDAPAKHQHVITLPFLLLQAGADVKRTHSDDCSTWEFELAERPLQLHDDSWVLQQLQEALQLKQHPHRQQQQQGLECSQQGGPQLLHRPQADEQSRRQSSIPTQVPAGTPPPKSPPEGDQPGAAAAPAPSTHARAQFPGLARHQSLDVPAEAASAPGPQLNLMAFQKHHPLEQIHAFDARLQSGSGAPAPVLGRPAVQQPAGLLSSPGTQQQQALVLPPPLPPTLLRSRPHHEQHQHHQQSQQQHQLPLPLSSDAVLPTLGSLHGGTCGLDAHATWAPLGAACVQPVAAAARGPPGAQGPSSAQLNLSLPPLNLPPLNLPRHSMLQFPVNVDLQAHFLGTAAVAPPLGPQHHHNHHQQQQQQQHNHHHHHHDGHHRALLHALPTSLPLGHPLPNGAPSGVLPPFPAPHLGAASSALPPSGPAFMLTAHPEQALQYPQQLHPEPQPGPHGGPAAAAASLLPGGSCAAAHLHANEQLETPHSATLMTLENIEDDLLLTQMADGDPLGYTVHTPDLMSPGGLWSFCLSPRQHPDPISPSAWFQCRPDTARQPLPVTVGVQQ